LAEHTSKSERVRRRRHDAPTTRAQILAVARDMFGRDGYGDVSLRQIASTVGVDAAMILRHFGSKDKLFAEAMRRPDLLITRLSEIPREAFGERIVRYVLGLDESSREFQVLVALLRSASHKTATGNLVEIANDATETLARWLGGKNSQLRATLISSQLVGLLVARGILGDRELAQSSNKVEIVAKVGPVIQHLVDGSD